jgi:hypothetical protein
MERDPIIGTLRANTDRIVELHFDDGEIPSARIILVDDEGVVYDLIASNRTTPYSPGQALWTTFDGIKEVVLPTNEPPQRGSDHFVQ